MNSQTSVLDTGQDSSQIDKIEDICDLARVRYFTYSFRKKIVVTLFILLALWTGKLRKYQIVRWSFWKAKIFERAHIYGYYQI